MRILHIIKQFYPAVGGVEQFTLNLCKQLIARGYQSDVVTFNVDFATGEKLEYFEKFQGINIHRIPFVGPHRYKVGFRSLQFLRDYDILHVHCIDSFIDYLALTKPLHRKPLVVSTHGGFFHSDWGLWFKKLYFRSITKLSLAAADKVICSSKADLKMFSSIAPKKSVLIYNGVNVEGFVMAKKDIQTGTVIYVGRTDENKRIDHLIKAVAVARSECPHIKLIIVGPDWLGIRPQLESLVRDLGIEENVHFAGACSHHELVEYLSRAHVFASASAYEGFGIAAVEAMSTGTVPVLNRIEPFREITENGEYGYLTDFEKPEIGARTLVNVLTSDLDELKSLGEKAREKASRFSWNTVVKEFDDVYRGIVR